MQQWLMMIAFHSSIFVASVPETDSAHNAPCPCPCHYAPWSLAFPPMHNAPKCIGGTHHACINPHSSLAAVSLSARSVCRPSQRSPSTNACISFHFSASQSVSRVNFWNGFLFTITYNVCSRQHVQKTALHSYKCIHLPLPMPPSLRIRTAKTTLGGFQVPARLGTFCVCPFGGLLALSLHHHHHHHLHGQDQLPGRRHHSRCTSVRETG